jgi:hypothetical protein
MRREERRREGTHTTTHTTTQPHTQTSTHTHNKQAHTQQTSTHTQTSTHKQTSTHTNNHTYKQGRRIPTYALCIYNNCIEPWNENNHEVHMNLHTHMQHDMHSLCNGMFLLYMFARLDCIAITSYP